MVGTILLYTSTNLLDFSPSISTDSSDNQSSLVVEDKFSKYPRVSELLQSEKSKIFITEVLKIDDSDTLLEYLEANKNLGRLTFGRRGNYAEIEGKYIIILDGQQIYTLLLYLNQRYFDVMGDGIYDDLSKNFRGKIEIWVNLL